MKKLIRLAQSRANNTGHTQYVVRCATTDKTKVKQNPQRAVAKDLVLMIVTPDAKTRIALMKRRKTRGGNRVRVGNNAR